MSRHTGFYHRIAKWGVNIFVGLIRLQNAKATIHVLKHWYRMLIIQFPPFIMWIDISWMSLQSFSSIRPQTLIDQSSWSRTGGISSNSPLQVCSDRLLGCLDTNSSKLIFVCLQGPVRTSTNPVWTPRRIYAQNVFLCEPRSKVLSMVYIHLYKKRCTKFYPKFREKLCLKKKYEYDYSS